MTTLYPLTFDPVFKDYPWGGRNLETRLGRTIPDGIVAESWEIAAHPNGSSPINNGALAGKTLTDAMALWGRKLVGSNCAEALASEKFPLLIKLLDANRWLSVQVHPNDEYGLAHGGDLGKTEMWVVLHAEPNAEIIYGFNRAVTREQYAQEIRDGEAEKSLHRLSVKNGDVIFVPAGSIHALGPGVIVAEIQQNSDTTYRVYDWGRPRPIHVEEALAVLDFSLVAPQATAPTPILDEDGLRVELLAKSPYFETERVTLPTESAFYGLCDGTTFELWGLLQGQATIEWDGEPITISAISWVLLPADLGEYQIYADESSVLLHVIVPEAEEGETEE